MLNDLNNDNSKCVKFTKKFSFGINSAKDGYINIKSTILFNSELGYGFVTESVKEEYETLQIAEIGNAFEIEQTLAGQSATNIVVADEAFSDKNTFPICFRVKVPRSGNYNVKLVLGSSTSDAVITAFSERRRCVLRNLELKAGEFVEHSFTANVCDIIPRGKTEPHTDDGLDFTVLGNNAGIKEIIIEEVITLPTIYIAGDSTVTDQSSKYPYNPNTSYCGWAQMFPMFLKEGMAVSNHAHSGLTTNSFKREGHWNIVEQNIKQNDLFFIQFGHNDQKDKTLEPFGGYAENLRVYIDEVRAKGAFPIIVTPVSRTIWNGPDGAFNDMLIDYSKACKLVAKEKDVPLIDLHDKSVEFILKHGPTAAIKYFYPKDWTHHNDFGGFEMAKLVVEAIKEEKIAPIVEFLRELPMDRIHHEQLLSWHEPSKENVQEQYKIWMQSNQWAQEFTVPEYNDITNHWAKSAIESVIKLGIMKGNEEGFLPEDSISRVEFFDFLLKAFRYPPTNVYNDMYSDVFGDEWYAGIVQASYENELIPDLLVCDNKFEPLKPLKIKDAVCIINNAVKCKLKLDYADLEELKSFNSNANATRALAAVLIKSLIDKLTNTIK